MIWIIIVKYYYVHESAGVVENHIDVKTGKILADEKYTGYEGDDYKTEPKDIIGYELVQEQYPNNAEGKMTIEEIVVNYYYIKLDRVIVEYVDKYTDAKLIPDVVIEGKQDQEYKTEQKEFEGYDFIEVVGATEGTMSLDVEEKVTYYYLRPATVITKYVDIDTNGEIAEQTEENGHQGDEYITAAKTIEYYKITKLPDNSTGIMDGTIEVIYYYRKLTFDLEIDKTINSLKINGKSKKITDEELVKAEVYRKEVDSTKIEVVYKITVRNKGEIAGKAVILEKIPENMKMNKSKNTGWEIDGKEARIETKEIAPGGSATYKVTLEWVKGDGNFGTIRNVAKLEKVENTPNYEEKDLSNNSDDADVIVTVSTGIEKVSMIAIIALIYILSAVYVNKRLDFAKVRIESDEKSDK